MLQRASKEAKYGVQFSPYEGTADGVMICGITEGGPGDGQVTAFDRFDRFERWWLVAGKDMISMGGGGGDGRG